MFNYHGVETTPDTLNKMDEHPPARDNPRPPQNTLKIMKIAAASFVQRSSHTHARSVKRGCSLNGKSEESHWLISKGSAIGLKGLSD